MQIGRYNGFIIGVLRLDYYYRFSIFPIEVQKKNDSTWSESQHSQRQNFIQAAQKSALSIIFSGDVLLHTFDNHRQMLWLRI